MLNGGRFRGRIAIQVAQEVPNCFGKTRMGIICGLSFRRSPSKCAPDHFFIPFSPWKCYNLSTPKSTELVRTSIR